ncbi:MAG: regulatory protein RecX [Bacteroidota bacterium]
MKQNHQSYTVKEALVKLAQYCAYQDRCHYEVEQKLREMNMIPEAQEQIIIKLIAEDFLNESRFVESFVRGKFNVKKWGKQKIKQHLIQKRIPQHLIKLGLQQIDESVYYETAKDLAIKKHENLGFKKDQKSKQKILRYLANKGYELSVCYDVINAIFES